MSTNESVCRSVRGARVRAGVTSVVLGASLTLGACASGGQVDSGSPLNSYGADGGEVDASGGGGVASSVGGWPGAGSGPDPVGGSGGTSGGGRGGSPSGDAGGVGGSSDVGGSGGSTGACLGQGVSCMPNGVGCCGGLTCGDTTAGTVCCGEDGTACATPNGSDCCGNALICVGGRCQAPGAGRPEFAVPFPCGTRWTYSHHSQEVRLALDFVSADGGATDGAPVLASAPGVASRRYEAGGAGNYIVIQHGDGWTTYYFHLSSFTVEDGAWVGRGQEVGRVGTTGSSSGPHLHYEQLHSGVGQTIFIDGVSLAPYPSGYFARDVTSENGCDTAGRSFSTWGSNRPVHASPTPTSPQVAVIATPTNVFVDCQTLGESVTSEGYTNAWWSHLRDHGGYITNIYIADPAAKLPGVPECP